MAGEPCQGRQPPKAGPWAAFTGLAGQPHSAAEVMGWLPRHRAVPPKKCGFAPAATDDLRSVRVHSGFHFKTIAALPRHLSWQLTQAQVLAMVEDIEQNFPED